MDTTYKQSLYPFFFSNNIILYMHWKLDQSIWFGFRSFSIFFELNTKICHGQVTFITWKLYAQTIIAQNRSKCIESVQKHYSISIWSIAKSILFYFCVRNCSDDLSHFEKFKRHHVFYNKVEKNVWSILRLFLFKLPWTKTLCKAKSKAWG